MSDHPRGFIRTTRDLILVVLSLILLPFTLIVVTVKRMAQVALEMLEDHEVRTVNLTVLYQLDQERSASVSPALIRLSEKCRELIRNCRR